MPRRNAFIGFHPSKMVPDGEKRPQEEQNLPAIDPLDFIPAIPVKRKRSRAWEQTHRNETVTYRGIPPQLIEKVNEIAQGLSVPRDEVIRAFLEYGVQLYRDRQIVLFAYPKTQRMTLFPENENANQVCPSAQIEARNWLHTAFPVPEKRSGKTKMRKEKQELAPAWKARVTFRIPVYLKEETRKIALEHTVPVGEVVCFFIHRGMKSIQDGSLTLRSFPKAAGKTLFQEE